MENILKQLLVPGFNLRLVMRKLPGFGKPRQAQDGLPVALSALCRTACALRGAKWRRLSRLAHLADVPVH